MWFPFPPLVTYREKGLKSLQSSTDMPHSEALGFCLYLWFSIPILPVHSLTLCPAQPMHCTYIWWNSITDQLFSSQCQKVYLVCKTTKPNTLLYAAWNSAAVFTSLPRNHRNIYHCMVTLYLSHTSPGILERTVLQTSAHLKYLWGIQHVVAALNWFLTRKENTFFNHSVEMFSLWANFRNIHRPILRLVFLRARDRKVATCLNKRSLSTSSRVQYKLLSKKQFENRAVKALTVI